VLISSRICGILTDHAYRSVLGTGQGLVRAFELQRPRPPDRPLWQFLGVLTGEAGVGLAVGAAGSDPWDVSRRGVGECVERFALKQVDAEQCNRPEALQGLVNLPKATWLESGLINPKLFESVAWGVARRLQDGQAVSVPAALFDYPSLDEDVLLVDASPSGAASALSLQEARRAAILEIIERDAFQMAWTGLLHIDFLAAHEYELAGGEIEATIRCLKGLGCELYVGVVRQSDLPPTWVAVAISDGSRGPAVAVGLKATTDASRGIAGACRESVQVATLVRGVAKRPTGRLLADADHAQGIELRKVAHLATSDAERDARAFVSRFRRGLKPDSGQALSNDSVDSILFALYGRGIEILEKDISHRLPETARLIGWRVVKLVALGLQPLRLDERQTWSWSTSRLSEFGNAEECLIRARASPPHPLP